MFQAAELTQHNLQFGGMQPASELPANGESRDGVYSRKFVCKPQVDGREQPQHCRFRGLRLLLAMHPAMLWIVQQPGAHVPPRNCVDFVTTHTVRGITEMLEPVVRVAGRVCAELQRQAFLLGRVPAAEDRKQLPYAFANEGRVPPHPRLRLQHVARSARVARQLDIERDMVDEVLSPESNAFEIVQTRYVQP